MIRALAACLRRPEIRRIVGAAALVAFVLVIVLGASHVAEKSAPGHANCGVCDAVAAIGTSESFAAPQLSAHLALTDLVVPHDARVLLANEPRRSHATRGPPSLA